MRSAFSVATKIRFSTSPIRSEKNCCPISRAIWLLPHPGFPDKYTVLTPPLAPLESSFIFFVILPMSWERLMISCGGVDARKQKGWSFALISCVRALFSCFAETRSASVLWSALFVSSRSHFVWSNSSWRSRTCLLKVSTSFVGKVFWFFISWISVIVRSRDVKAFNSLTTEVWRSASVSLASVICAISFRTWRISSTSFQTAGLKVVPTLSEYRMAKNKQEESHSAVFPPCIVVRYRAFFLRLFLDSLL